MPTMVRSPGLWLALLPLLLLVGCQGKILVIDWNLLPVFFIVENPVTPEKARTLAGALGLDPNGSYIADDGAIRFLDPTRFQTLPMRPAASAASNEDDQPTVAEAFDFDAIAALRPFDPGLAEERARAALRAAGLDPDSGTVTVTHARFEAVRRDGTPVADIAIDTQVIFDAVTPNDFPLRGPGADIKIAFDADGVVTQIVYARRILAEGERVKVLSQRAATRLAAARVLDVEPQRIQLRGACATAPASGVLQPLCLQAETVYYAPPLEDEPEQLVPHYVFQGSLAVEGRTVPIRNLVVPAVEAVPQVQLDVTVDGVRVQAESRASGGTPPYAYTWVASNTPLPPGLDGPSIGFLSAPREGELGETLSVIVTDANGLRSWTSRSLPPAPAALPSAAPAPTPAAAPTPQQADAGVEAGIEWIGLTQGLPGSAANTRGFAAALQRAEVPLTFDHGELAAFERDFIDVERGGSDRDRVDGVDFVFYTGHATGSGFTFESPREGRFLFYDEARWGDGDLEWLLIAACGPLQEEEASLPWWRRWGPAFDGLHLLLGYANITYDNEREGRLFGEGILEQNLKLRQAWAATATDVQTATEIYAVMGVFDADGVNNYNDHFWGRGAVGPDIPDADVSGYWRLSSPS